MDRDNRTSDSPFCFRNHRIAMIYITGDTHASFLRFTKKRFPAQNDMKKDDLMIIAGDFGGVFYQKNDIHHMKAENSNLDELNSRSFTTVFVPGNHENYDRLMSDEFPVRKWKNGLVKEIRPSVLMLMRGEVYEIDGVRLFAFGGARSHDISDGILDPYDQDWKTQEKNLKRRKMKNYRVKGISWWEAELPTEEEMQHGLASLEKCGWEVDFVVTHCASTSSQKALDADALADPLTEYLEEIQEKVNYRQWYFGHYHRDCQITQKDNLLYERIIRIQ